MEIKSQEGIIFYATSYSEEITGSNTILIIRWPDGRETRQMFDFGIFQEKAWKSLNGKILYDAKKINAVHITHPHADHTGQLPRLEKLGFEGTAYCSEVTKFCLPTMLDEVAERSEEDFKTALKEKKKKKEEAKKAKKARCGSFGKKDIKRCEKGKDKKKKKNESGDKKGNKKGKQLKDEEGKKPREIKESFEEIELLFSKDDARDFMKRVESIEIGKTFSPEEGLEITYYPNGHVAGSVLIIVRAFDENESLTLLLTGDIGLKNGLTGIETNLPKKVADQVSFIICESTYGGNMEKINLEEENQKFEVVIRRACDENKRIVCPSYAFEKPMILRKELSDMSKTKEMSKYLKQMPIFFDTKLGLKFQDAMEDAIPELKDYKRFKHISKRDGDYKREYVQKLSPPYMLVCTSPRFNQGSLLSYLELLSDKNTIILLYCGYIPEDVQNYITLPKGTKVKIHGEMITLNCEFEIVRASAHMDRGEILDFLSQFKNAKVIMFHHGLQEGKQSMVDEMTKKGIVSQNMLCERTIVLDKNGVMKTF